MTLDSYAAGTICILISVLVAVLGLLVVRKTYNVSNLARAHAISGQYLSIVGTMYAVLLGLIVVDAMARFQQAALIVEAEANGVAELIYLCGRMPAPQRTRINELAVRYIHLVSEREWPLLAHGQSLDEASACAFDLMRTARDWEPVTESEKVAYASAVPTASDFWNARRHRLLASQRGIPTLEWCVVILGGIVTVGLTYVFVFDDLRIQITLTALVALLISFNIFLILMFGYPFSGDVKVSPRSFEVTLFAIPLGEPGPGAR